MQRILDQFKLNGQAAIIAGGNRGLGLEMAKALAEAGANICIASRDEERNNASAELIRKDYGVKCVSRSCDITSEQQVSDLVDFAVNEFGKVEILINSAGINIRGAIADVSLADFEKVQQVNVTGPWLLCRKVMPLMKRNGYGRVINLGSMLSSTAIAERTPYTTSKGAILQLTRALAIEFAKDKVNVNAILPGPFATELNLPLTKDPEKYKAFMNLIPMGRWGELHEIGALALYLASPASSFVTGGMFSIDGGWIAT